MESVRDLTRILIWEFHSTKFDFWEEGRVEIEKFEEYKVRDKWVLKFHFKQLHCIGYYNGSSWRYQ